MFGLRFYSFYSIIIAFMPLVEIIQGITSPLGTVQQVETSKNDLI